MAPDCSLECHNLSRPIQKIRLSVQVADCIEQDISAGVWIHHLPGRRPLADRYEVSVKTCVAALTLLEDRGVIAAAEPGKARAIIRRAVSKSRKRHLNLLVLQQIHSELSHEDAYQLSSTQAIWENAGGHVIRRGVDFPYHKNPAKLIDKLIENHSADAIFLLSPTAPWGLEASRRIPTFQIGGHVYDTLKISFFGFRLRTEIPKVVRYLRDQGHRKIFIAATDETLHPFTLSGLKSGYDDEVPNIRLEDYCQVCPSSDPDGWAEFWKKNLFWLKPSAVVVHSETQLLSLYGHCSRNGLKIPDDLSVISMRHHPLLNWIYPKPTMMQFPADHVIREFKKWMDNNLHEQGNHFLPLTRLDGESVTTHSD
ncbi:hypothetical protein NT6N_06510 [Oceaniferula spumae]|uniref:Transcriptional regulator LacI/GalR-like sensor domain-containing protein n=1 Tax=Oceaniferula spumae TaxID=2979115 RepID=A0AAT9FI20_9BACT